ncbi:hypothetical protein RQP46_003444 [Phenoliferia psychrophenolica]
MRPRHHPFLALAPAALLIASALGSTPPSAGFLIAGSPRAHAQFVYNPISFPSEHATPHLFTTPAHGTSGDRATSPLQLSQLATPPQSGSAAPMSPSRGTRIIGNEDSNIAYFPEEEWTTIRGASFITGSLHRTSSSAHSAGPRLSRSTPTAARKASQVSPTTSTMTFTFTGHGIDWYGSKSPFHGQASVRLDGKEVAVVDAYSPRWLDQQLLFSSSRDLPLHGSDAANLTGGGGMGLGMGRHEIQVVVRGEGQRRSRGTAVDLDMFLVYEGTGEVRKKRPVVGGSVTQATEAAMAKGRRTR